MTRGPDALAGVLFALFYQRSPRANRLPIFPKKHGLNHLWLFFFPPCPCVGGVGSGDARVFAQNRSFGDYFKEEAVEWGFEALNEVFGLPADRLYATYFGGDEELGLAPDLETRDLWLKVLPEDRVMPGDRKDNFWEVGRVCSV